MAFNNEIRVLNTSDTNHADNFNEPLQELLENTQFNAKQIGVLSEDRGYLNSKLIPITTDIDTVIENGVYTWEYGDNSKKPAGGGSYFVRVQKIVETYILQEVTMGWGEGKTYTRVMDNGKWGEWVCDSDKITALQTSKLDKLIFKTNESLNQLLPFGIYRFFAPSDGLPDGYTSDSDFILYNNNLNINTADKWAPQILLDVRNNKTFTRRVADGSFPKWSTIATTDKIDILATPTTGYTIFSQNCYQINNIIYVNIRFNKTDDSAMSADGFINPLSLPISVGDTTLNFCGNTANGFWSSTGSCLVSGTSILVTPVKECTGGRISGVIVL